MAPHDAKLTAGAAAGGGGGGKEEEDEDDAAALNDLCAAAASGGGAGRWRLPFPAAAAWALAALLAAGVGVGALVLAVLHDAALLAASASASVAVAAFLLWNAAAATSGRALRLFMDGFPASSLRSAADGQLVKISGFVSCGDISLISSYEKVENCVYTSTLMRTCGKWSSYMANPKNRCSRWKLAHAERFAADFYITDAKSGIRALVKAGRNSKVVPLIDENVLVTTTSRNTELSSTLTNWLEERNLSSESHLICLEEGYINEGMSVSVMGILSKKNGDIMILPPPEPISTGCLLRSFLLPADVEGLVVKISERNYFVPNPGIS